MPLRTCRGFTLAVSRNDQRSCVEMLLGRGRLSGASLVSVSRLKIPTKQSRKSAKSAARYARLHGLERMRLWWAPCCSGEVRLPCQ